MLRGIDGDKKPTDGPLRIETNVILTIDTDYNLRLNLVGGTSTGFAIGDTGFVVIAEGLDFDMGGDAPKLVFASAELIPPDFMNVGVFRCPS